MATASAENPATTQASDDRGAHYVLISREWQIKCASPAKRAPGENPINPLGCHTGAGRYPDHYRFPAQVGQHFGFVRFAEHFLLLDTNLRRYDAVFSNGFLEWILLDRTLTVQLCENPHIEGGVHGGKQ